ncbi:hypothetical protein FRC20_009437 [Serendipita sp. 405]|nr:hypothetical protein FRC20_009437 [Serendipita sp. 405]
MSDPSSSPSASSLSPQSPIKRTSNGHGSSSPAIFQEERLEGTILLPASLARNRPALSGLKSEGLRLVTHSYDVGLDGMFQSIPQEDIPLIERSCRSIAKAYTKESQNKEWFIKWNNRLCEKPEEVAWSFHIDHHTAHRGVYSPNSPNKIVVLSVPIAHQTRIKSRGTRCYLAFDYALVDGNPFYKMLNKEIMKHVHTLKTSWVSPLRSPEFEFYQKAIARQADAKAKGIKFEDFHLATMLSGGYIEGSLQDYSREHKSGMGSQKELPSQNARQINWLLMKEVGRPIGTFQNGREFLEVIRDTAKTLQALYDLRILHRDVSAKNVLIDIVTGCGLLIDLDLAKDLDENQHSGRPAVTGTSGFISLSFDDAQFPLHTLWHDLESLYWTALYISIRHRSQLSTGIKKVCNLSEDHNRTLCLGDIFPNRRKEFLSIGEFNCSDDSALNHFILRMQDVYKQNYSLMDTFHLWVMFLATPLRGLLEMASKSEACIKKTKILDILSCLQAHKTHQMYEHQGKRELGEYIQGWLDLGQNLDAAYSHSFFEELPDTLQEDIGNVHKGMRTVQSALQDLLFPDTELFLKYLNQALSGSKATSNHPGIKYNPPRQTTKEEQFRHGVGPLTHLSPTALSSHHSQTRFTVDNVINETDDGADDTEAGE